MSISCFCPGCQAPFSMPDEAAGKQARCQKCSTVFEVPRAPSSAGEETAAYVPGEQARDAFQQAPRQMPSTPTTPASNPAPAADTAHSREREQTTGRAAPRSRELARGRHKTPVFVWLVPVLFGALFLVLAVVGVFVINSRNHRVFAAQGPFMKKAVVQKQVWDMPKAVVEAEMKAAPLPPPPVFQFFGEPEGPGLTIEGALADHDALDPQRPGCRCKVYDVRLTAGRTYVIEMNRKLANMDPLLRLTDVNGNTLASDDDSGADRNARIVYTAQMTGNHRIVTTTFGPATGEFTLIVRLENAKK